MKHYEIPEDGNSDSDIEDSSRKSEQYDHGAEADVVFSVAMAEQGPLLLSFVDIVQAKTSPNDPLQKRSPLSLEINRRSTLFHTITSELLEDTYDSGTAHISEHVRLQWRQDGRNFVTRNGHNNVKVLTHEVGKPLWQLLDEAVTSQRRESKRHPHHQVTTERESKSERSVEDDELWRNFWRHYRKDERKEKRPRARDQRQKFGRSLVDVNDVNYFNDLAEGADESELSPRTIGESFLPSIACNKRDHVTRPESVTTCRTPRLPHIGQQEQMIACEPTRRYKGFYDYKKWCKATCVEKGTPNTKELLSGTRHNKPICQARAALREHHEARCWRLRTALDNGCVSQDLEPTESSFHRPWSREQTLTTLPEHLPHAVNAVHHFAEISRRTGVNPRAESVLFLAKGLSELNLRKKGYADGDLLALAAAMSHTTGVAVVDLGENSRLTDGAVRTMLQIISSHHGDTVEVLRLDHNKGLSNPTIAFFAQELHSSLSELYEVDISGIIIGRKEYLSLSSVITSHKAVRILRLVDTGLGRFDKTHTRQCLGHIISNQRLQALDIGWNSLDTSAFELLLTKVQKHGALNTLGLANTGTLKDIAFNCSPIVIFCEAGSSLGTLDISYNYLDKQAPMVLESVFSRHPKLEALDMSHNALGLEGKRSLLRLLAKADGRLKDINMDECSNHIEADDSSGFSGNCEHPFRVDPSGSYQLQMAHPGARAMLRLMLDRFCSQASAGIAPETMMRDGKLQQNSSCVDFDFSTLRCGQGSVWEVPHEGVLTFIVDARELFARVGADLSFAGSCVSRVLMQTRIGISGAQEKLVLGQVKCARREQDQHALLEALSRDFVLTPAQAWSLCKTDAKKPNCGRDFVGSCGRLLPSIIGAQNMRETVTVSSSLHQLTELAKIGASLLNLNLENPTGHYKLDLGVPADRATVLRLLILNRWELLTCIVNGRIDASQAGNKKNFRNVFYGDRAIAWKEDVWQVPRHDVLDFDFVSLRRPPANAKALGADIFKQMMVHLRYALCKDDLHREELLADTEAQLPYERERTLRDVVQLDDGHLDVKEVKRVSFMQLQRRNNVVPALSALRGHSGSQENLFIFDYFVVDADVVWVLRALSALFWLTCLQLRELLCLIVRFEPRLGLLVALVMRAVDWPVNGNICMAKFSHAQRDQICSKLGHLVCFPYFQFEGLTYKLDLSSNEERRLFFIIFALTHKDDGEGEGAARLAHLKVDWQGPRAHPVWVEPAQGITQSWSQWESMPESGAVWLTTTFSARPVDAKWIEERRSFAHTHGGWDGLPHDDQELDGMLMPWTCVDSVPPDVGKVAGFLTDRFDSLRDCFDALDRNGDGDLVQREFVAGMERLGFRLVEKRPIQILADTRLTKVERRAAQQKKREKILVAMFGHLKGFAGDAVKAEHDTPLTWVEFSHLSGIWNELTQVTYEFVLTLQHSFPSLKHAWSAVDVDQKGKVIFQDFCKLAEKIGFFGPMHHLFLRIDDDNSGSIGLDEWLRLESVKGLGVDAE